MLVELPASGLAEMRVNAGWIEQRLLGGTTWNQVLALSELDTAPLYLTSAPVDGVTDAEDGQLVRVSDVLGEPPFANYLTHRSGAVETTVFAPLEFIPALETTDPIIARESLIYSIDEDYGTLISFSGTIPALLDPADGVVGYSINADSLVTCTRDAGIWAFAAIELSYGGSLYSLTLTQVGSEVYETPDLVPVWVVTNHGGLSSAVNGDQTGLNITLSLTVSKTVGIKGQNAIRATGQNKESHVCVSEVPAIWKRTDENAPSTDTTGEVIFDPVSGEYHKNGGVAISMGDGILRDTFSYPGTVSLNWNERSAYGPSGSVVFSWNDQFAVYFPAFFNGDATFENYTYFNGLAAFNGPAAFTGTVSGVSSAMVGLGNVDNTSNATERAATATLTNKSINASQLTGTVALSRLVNMQTVGDANTTITSGVRDVHLTATLTAPRNYYLPLAADYPAGSKITFTDTTGGVSATNTATVFSDFTNTLNGGVGISINLPRSSVIFVSNGSGAWTSDIRGIARGGTGATTQAGAWTNLGGAGTITSPVLTSLTINGTVAATTGISLLGASTATGALTTLGGGTAPTGTGAVVLATSPVITSPSTVGVSQTQSFGTAGVGGFKFDPANNLYQFSRASDGNAICKINTGANSLECGTLVATSNNVVLGNYDTYLSRKGAGILGIGASSGSITGEIQVAKITASGDIAFGKTITASGTTGAQTINKTSGSVNLAAAATSLVVTNSLVTTSSVIQCTVGTNDTTAKSVQVVAAAGSFTIYPNTAPTAETKVFFTVTN